MISTAMECKCLDCGRSSGGMYPFRLRGIPGRLYRCDSCHEDYIRRSARAMAQQLINEHMKFRMKLQAEQKQHNDPRKGRHSGRRNHR